MKINLVLMFLYYSFYFHSQTATDFTAMSCGGISHNLFNALDTGKIVVLTWVKPEGSNINFVESAYSIVQEFEVTNPNRVSLFICDDYSNTSCAALNGWMTGKTFSQCTSFSDNSIKMSDYNLNGVPKIAVIANSTHYVFDVQVNNLNDSLLREIIRSIIIGPVTQPDTIPNNFQSSIMPNPVNNSLTVKYKLTEKENLILEIFSSEGKIIKSISSSNNHTGTNNMQIDTQTLNTGTYFFKISNGKKEDKIKFIVTQ